MPNKFLNMELQEEARLWVETLKLGLQKRAEEREAMATAPAKQVVVVDRVLTPAMQQVPGISTYLNMRKDVRTVLKSREVEDPFSHCSRNVADIHTAEQKTLFHV